MTTVLVTGAAGFIGRHLCCQLAASGQSVIGLGHGAWPDPDAAASGVSHWINGDISASNLHSLRSMHGMPEAVFHLAGGSSVAAAVASPREDFFRTVVTTAELLDWLRSEAPQARLVAVSSAAVYGAGHAGPISEAAPLRPCSPYGHHKLLMELLCRSYGATYGLPIVVGRLFSVYGAGLRKQLLWDLCRKIQEGGRVKLGGNGTELRDWTDVRDVVRALVDISTLATADVPTFNVGTGVGTSVREIAASVLAAWDAGKRRHEIEFDGKARTGDPTSLQADQTLLGALGFDWRIPLSQGLTDYVRWFRSKVVQAE